jgi:hypothetical protein
MVKRILLNSITLLCSDWQAMLVLAVSCREELPRLLQIEFVALQ